MAEGGGAESARATLKAPVIEVLKADTWGCTYPVGNTVIMITDRKTGEIGAQTLHKLFTDHVEV